MVLEVVPHSKSGKRYARKRTSIDGKKRFVGCGQEGSEKHRKALATVHRRNLLEQIIALAQQVEAVKTSQDWQALTNPPQTKEPEIAEPEIVETEVPTVPQEPELPIISFAFKGGKGATPENRVVHAVPNEPPAYFFWDNPALCGARPSPSLNSWGWIGDCTIFYLSCKKCEKKLKSMDHRIKLPES